MSDTPSIPPAGPLAGIKVLELGQLIAGPFAAKVLADFGADVIKIEPPVTGDPLLTGAAQPMTADPLPGLALGKPGDTGVPTLMDRLVVPVRPGPTALVATTLNVCSAPWLRPNRRAWATWPPR